VKDWPGNIRQLRKVVENAGKLSGGYGISKEDIARQLEYQDLENKAQRVPAVVKDEAPASAPAGRISFPELKQKWQHGEMQPAELERLLHDLYAQGRKNWRRSGRLLGITTEDGIRTFRNWIYYLERTGAIRLPGK
jgi:transcriptional regulator with AAA-type ATPase domain